MNKKNINEIVKLTKKEKDKEWSAPFGNPTIEECEALYKKDVSVTPVTCKMQGIMGGSFLQTGVHYSLEV